MTADFGLDSSENVLAAIRATLAEYLTLKYADQQDVSVLVNAVSAALGEVAFAVSTDPQAAPLAHRILGAVAAVLQPPLPRSD